MKLAGRTAIITGGSRGIGKEICLAFARQGANIAVVARTEQPGQRLTGTIHETVDAIRASGGNAIAIRTDLTREEDISAMVAQTLEEYGRIDILVNDAAANFNGTVHDLSVKRLDVMLNVNLRGTMLCSKAVLPVMMDQRSGHILALTSIAAKRRAPPGEVCYSVTKAGIEMFCWSLAQEVREYNIAVNDLYPTGGVLTDGFREVFKHHDNAEVLLEQMSKPEEIAEAALWMVQQNAEQLTACSLSHDEALQLARDL